MLVALAARAGERQDLQYRSSAETGFAYQPAGKGLRKPDVLPRLHEDAEQAALAARRAPASRREGRPRRRRLDGHTIGYFGRPFETKKLQELDANDPGYTRFEVGKGEVIPGLEEAVLGMAEGGVRQIVVPPEIGYPDSDPSHERVGPKPSTFSGQRALDFVLQNQQLIDKTLLFNVKLVRVDEEARELARRAGAGDARVASGERERAAEGGGKALPASRRTRPLSSTPASRRDRGEPYHVRRLSQIVEQQKQREAEDVGARDAARLEPFVGAKGAGK